MLAHDGARPLGKIRNNRFRHIQVIQADRNSGDVNDGIHRSHFMKMHPLHALTVHFALRLDNDPKDLQGDIQRALRQVS